MSYFIRLRDKIYGPFDEARLKKMRDTGKIGRTTDISEDGIVWQPAGASGILYPSTRPSTPSAVVVEPEPWFYSVDGSEGYGPVSESVIVESLRSGRLGQGSYVWREGERARPLRSVPEFSVFFPDRAAPSSMSNPVLLFGIVAVSFLAMACIVVGIMLVRGGSSTSGPSVSSSSSTEKIIEKAEPSVARIQGEHGSGTGFLIQPGILATNQHVIDGELIERVKIHFPSVSDHRKGPYDTKLLYYDADRDIAFLEIKSALPSLSLVENHRFKRGQDIIAIGSPGALENAVNIGVLSSEVVIDDQDYYQLGISINPGNSGGPVLDRRGRVIGIATLKSGIQEGIAFCIPAADIRDALSKMKRLSESDRARNNSRHRAEVALKMLFKANAACSKCMMAYDASIKIALDRGMSPNAAINAVSEIIDKEMAAVQYIYLDDVEKELEKIQKDGRLPQDFRIKFAEFYANCMEIKSYVDNPRGTVASYKAKMIELVDTGDRLYRQLTAMLGILAEENE